MKRTTTQLIALALTTLFAINTQAQQPKLSSLEIVDKVEVNAERTILQSTATALNVNLSTALEKLGATDITAADIYTAEYDSENENAKDELTNQTNNFDSQAIGWWYIDVFDGESETVTGQSAAAPYTGGRSTLYIRDYALSTEGEFTLFVGHIKQNVEAGINYTLPLYIVKGGKAVQVDVKVSIGGGEASFNLADFTIINEKTVDLSLRYNGSYKYLSVEVPVDSLLGLIPQDDAPFSSQWYEDYYALTLLGLQSEGVLTNASTADYGGYWLDANGYVTDWGAESYLFIEPDWEQGLNKLHVGMYPVYPSSTIIGNTLSATVYVQGNGLYAINVNLEVLPQVTVLTCDTVATLDYVIEIEPVTDGSGAFLQPDYLKEAIDLTEFIEIELGLDGTTFNAENYLPGQGYSPITPAYQIGVGSGITDVAQGYQMMDLTFFGDPASTHIVSPFNPLPVLTVGYAIGYDNGKLNFWYKEGVRTAGDYYFGKFIIYNLDAEKRININITVVFVDKLNPKVDIIGETDLTLPKGNEAGDDYAATAFDLQSVVEALGAESADDIQWLAYNELGQLLGTFTYDDIYGYSFNEDGKVTASDSEDATFSIGYADGEFHTFADNPTGATTDDYKASIVAYYGTKAYKFNITLSDNPATAIECIPAVRVESNAATYDLSGRIVKNPTRGLFIQNGKKVLIK